jgi:hypothetical protein
MRIDKGLRTVISDEHGTVTEADLNDHQAALIADPNFDSAYNQLFSFLQTTKLDVSVSFIRGFASRRVFSANSKRAIVVPDEYIFGNARMFASLNGRSTDRIKVFRDMSEARLWLDLDP